MLEWLEFEADPVVVVLDSLIDHLPTAVADSACGVCSKEAFGRTEGGAEDYPSLLKKVRGISQDILRCLFEKAGLDSRFREMRIVVAPAVGRPGKDWEFQGNARDFIGAVLVELGDLILKKAYGRIVLDLTHGINFMPAELMYLARMLASLSLASHPELKEVEVEAYNSDPYSRGASLLNLNLVYSERFENIQFPSYLEKLLTPSGKPSKEVMAFNNETGELRGWVEDFLSSLYYPLPLALFELYDRKKAKSCIEEVKGAYELWKETTEVKEKRVYRRVAINYESVYAFLLTGAFSLYLRDKVKVPASPDRLMKVSDEIYSKVGEIHTAIIAQELSNLLRIQKEEQSQRLKKLEEWEQDGKKVDKRIMIAHAGLQRGLIKVESPEKVSIRYKRDVRGILKEASLRIFKSIKARS